MRENWRCGKVCHTHHEKHVGADAAQQLVQLRSEDQKQLVRAAKVAARDVLVDGAHVGGRGFARIDL